jgi:uncharacterized protein YbbC (DUF1343 family)
MKFKSVFLVQVYGLCLSGIFLFLSCKAVMSDAKKIETGAEQTALYLPLIKNKTVAVVANQTSLIGKTHLVDSLLALNIRVTKIFSPEHGFRGIAGAGDLIDNAIDTRTGIPVISLYGSRKKPSPAELEGVEMVIYDIQDVGVRFYTYISTLHYVMEACAELKIPVVILDRPDPLGFYVDGPVLDPAYRSFVGLHPIPVVYGMTVGELASMINQEGWLGNNLHCELKVIPCQNYDHNSRYLLPVNPSPNLNSMEAVYLYPSLCFFEGTVMSIGRGTDFPFRVIGHPEYPVRNFTFIPKADPVNKNPLFMNKTCYGIDLRSKSIQELQQENHMNLQWLLEVYETMNPGESFFTDYIDKLAGSDQLRKQILHGETKDQISKAWSADLEKFRQVRKKYLLYKDFN